MPRLNLTDEEAALIERRRAKNAKAVGFNEGAQRGMDWMHDQLSDKIDAATDLHENQKTKLYGWIMDAIKLGQATLFMELK